MKEVVIAAASRTPIGSFGGSLAKQTAPELGAVAIGQVLKESGIRHDDVDEVAMGCVLTAGIGQAPARQAALKAGLPENTPCTTVNKVCASGMKSVMYAANMIQAGDADVIVAGGMESMSNVPYYLPNERFGAKLGHTQAQDGILKDGLWDVYKDFHMGNAGEICAKECNISREEQDKFAEQSYRRSQKAHENGWLKDQIAPVKVKGRKGETEVIESDEEIYKVKFEKIASLKPAFDKNGTITAANAPSINDGAAALLVMSREKAEEYGITPLAVIRSQASSAKAPEWFTTAPADAIPTALKKANIDKNQVDLFEINEAFSVVALANNQILGLDEQKVNIHGGAVSMGHPIGCSGARILVTLIYALKQNDGKLGCAGICNGGGGASAMVIEMQ